MREIKFRAWDGESIIDFKKLQDMPLHLLNGNGMWTFMQYTGLKDKNGKEIYEGDVIYVDDETIEVKAPNLFECDAFVVYGYEFCSCFFIENYNKVGLDRFYSYEPEIIGNIYQNPKLLKK